MLHPVSKEHAETARAVMTNWMLANKVPVKSMDIAVRNDGHHVLVIWMSQWQSPVRLPLISNGVPIAYQYAP